MTIYPIQTTDVVTGIIFVISESADPAKPFFTPESGATTLVGGAVVVKATNKDTGVVTAAASVTIDGPKKVTVDFGEEGLPVGNYLVHAHATPLGFRKLILYKSDWRVDPSPNA